MNLKSPWLDWAIKIQTIAQTGQIYSTDKYDQERFEELNQISNEMFSHLSDTPVEQIEKILIPETGHPTPKVDIRAGIIRNSKFLLIQENEGGGWSIPGGWGEVCLTPSQAATQRVLEQTGLVVHSPRLIYVKDRSAHPYKPKFPFHVYKLFFVFESVADHPIAEVPTPGMDYFALDELPELAPNRVLLSDIELIFNHFHKNGSSIAVD